MNTEPNQPKPSQETESDIQITINPFADLLYNSGCSSQGDAQHAQLSNIVRAINSPLAKTTARIAELEKEADRLRLKVIDSCTAWTDANDCITSLQSRLSACEAENEELVEALQRVDTIIPRDFNQRTGMRGIHHDEQPDSPGGFQECDTEELLETIINHVESALHAHAARQKEGTQP